MEGVTVLAFTHCIEFQKGGEGGYIRDCKWHGFNIGLSLDNIHHIIMLDNTEAYPYWNGDANVQIYMYNNYVAYEIGRVDGLRVKGGMFSIWTNVGVGFVPSRSTDFPNQSSAFIDVDSIYSDSCVHGFMVYPGITGAPMTGTIGHMIVHRASITGLDIDSNPAVDYGVRLRGWCDFHVHHFEGSGSGFARKGGHVVATTDGSKMSIGHARVCEWDTDGLNKPAFSFGVAGTELSIEQPLDIFQGSGGWFVTTKRLFQGDASAGENNITTGRHLYLDGIGFVSNRSVTVNSAEQTLFASHPVKMLSAGYREYRARGRVGTHATTTTLTLHAGSATVITTALSCPASGSTLDVDGTWKTINLDPTTEPEFGALQAIGTPGDASLLFLRLGFEFR
jgi:hypothetical protein